MNQLSAEIRKIPPVTRYLVASSLVVTLGVRMNLLSGYWILFWGEKVVQKLQLWRLYTSFFMGPPGLGYIFELIMLYRTANDLESGPYAGRSADFTWQLIFTGATIIGLTRPFHAVIFERPFLIALVYLSSSLAPPGAQTSLFGLVTVPVQYFPYILIGLDLLSAGPQAGAMAIAGAVAGHIWLWAVWGTSLGTTGPLIHYARAPAWLRNVFGERSRHPRTSTGGPGAQMDAGGVHVVPPRGSGSGTSTGYNWGAGRTLGTR